MFIIIIIIIIVIINLVITFMQDIYNYIPETNHVSRVYSVVAIQYLQFVLHVMLFRPWNMFCTFTLAFPAVCVQWPIRLFFSVVAWFRFFPVCCSGSLVDFEMVPVALIITGVSFAFTFRVRWI